MYDHRHDRELRARTPTHWDAFSTHVSLLTNQTIHHQSQRHRKCRLWSFFAKQTKLERNPTKTSLKTILNNKHITITLNESIVFVVVLMFQLNQQLAHARRVATFARQLKVAKERHAFPRFARRERLVAVADKLLLSFAIRRFRVGDHLSSFTIHLLPRIAGRIALRLQRFALLLRLRVQIRIVLLLPFAVRRCVSRLRSSKPSKSTETSNSIVMKSTMSMETIAAFKTSDTTR